MGLDGVEIVMKIEETFDVVIEDSDAEKANTPGHLIELVMNKVGRTNDAACLTQRAFHRLRASLMRQVGLKRDQIRTETSLANLLPRPARKRLCRQVLADIGVRNKFELVRPEWLHHSIFAVTLIVGIALALWVAWHPVSSRSILVNFMLGSPVMAGVYSFVILAWLSFIATRGMRTEFRPSIATVALLSRWIVANAPDLVNAPPGQWSREQVSQVIREIVIDQLGCEKTYREDAHFVKDLGMA
jgi:acyl carrier protein